MSFFNQTRSYLTETNKSETLLINEHSLRLEAEGKEVYKFGFGQSPFSPPKAVIDSLKQYAHRYEYMAVQGHGELRKAAAAFHNKVLGLELKAENIFVAPGSKQLIFNIMSCFKTADVFLVTPSWVSYEPQAKHIGHKVVRIQTSFETRWHLTPEALDRALSQRKDTAKPALLIMNYPGNPDGMTYTAEELSAIAQVARRHRILIISDEIYGLLSVGKPYVSIAEYYPEGTIITTGLSKWCGAGGWRLGLALLPNEVSAAFKDALLGLASETYSAAAAPVQMAAITAYTDNSILDYVESKKHILQAAGTLVATALQRGGIKLHQPDGGFYLYPDFSGVAAALAGKGIKTSTALCTALAQETGVALLPGVAFGETPDRLTARLAYVDFNGDAAMVDLMARGGQPDQAFIDRHFAKLNRGTQKLMDWVGAYVH